MSVPGQEFVACMFSIIYFPEHVRRGLALVFGGLWKLYTQWVAESILASVKTHFWPIRLNVVSSYFNEYGADSKPNKKGASPSGNFLKREPPSIRDRI